MWNPEGQWHQAVTKGKAKTGRWQLTRAEALFFHLHTYCQSTGEKLKITALGSWLSSSLCWHIFGTGSFSLTLPFGMAIYSLPVLVHSQLLNATNSDIILYLSSTLQALLWRNKPPVLCLGVSELWGRCRSAVFFGILQNKWLKKSFLELTAGAGGERASQIPQLWSAVPSKEWVTFLKVSLNNGWLN